MVIKHFPLLNLEFWHIVSLVYVYSPSLSVLHLKTVISYTLSTFIVIFNVKSRSVHMTPSGLGAEVSRAIINIFVHSFTTSLCKHVLLLIQPENLCLLLWSLKADMLANQITPFLGLHRK